MNVTFFTAANNVSAQFNNTLAWILTGLLVASIFVFGISWFKRRQLPMIVSGMIGLWFLAGILLCCTGDNSLVSDWFSSGAMIGTIGAVGISLYLSLQAKKNLLIDEVKKALYLGMELLVIISNYDKLVINQLSGDGNDDKLLTQKITQFQWEIELIFDTNSKISKELIEVIQAEQLKAINICLEVCRKLVKSKYDQASGEIMNQIRDSVNIIDLFNKFISTHDLHSIWINELNTKLDEAFQNKSKYYSQIKRDYVDECKRIIKSH